MRRFFVWLCLNDAFIPAVMKWKHRKPTSEGGLIQIESLNKKLTFRFTMRDREFRHVEYLRPCDSGFVKDLPEQLKDCPLAALKFARDEVTFTLKLLFRSETELDAFMGHAQNIITRAVFRIDGPRERWRRRGCIVVLRALLRRHYRNDNFALMSWYDNTCPLSTASNSNNVVGKYAVGWLLSCCNEFCFREVIRFL